jgi:hypothetical protein
MIGPESSPRIPDHGGVALVVGRRRPPVKPDGWERGYGLGAGTEGFIGMRMRLFTTETSARASTVIVATLRGLDPRPPVTI